MRTKQKRKLTAIKTKELENKSSDDTKKQTHKRQRFDQKEKEEKIVPIVVDKEKLALNLLKNDKNYVLERIRKHHFSLCEITNYIDYLSDEVVGIQFLELVFDILVDYDVKIVSESENLSPSDWYAVESPVSTPISDDRCRELREDVQSFIYLFLEIQKYLKSNHITIITEIFEKYIFTSGTRYMQFLMFNFDPESVLIYFFSSIKRGHVLSEEMLGLVSSFIINRKLSDELLEKSIKVFFNLIKNFQGHSVFWTGLQFFLTIITKYHQFYDEYSDFILPLLQEKGCFLNKKIVNSFLKKFNHKPVKYFFKTSKGSIDRFFFDSLNITMIKDSFADELQLNKSTDSL
ncbi:hypothetical protein M153_872000989 [Pseudoloma neurophilia]|uniref:Uncharacterized protein n=1 Tax=Pseudoloma neurophilia TaxID=146866 RepID=A0A0R0LVP8_9MICR|nr:hypothetical protein M153_872000989 [Pseudoloma neurophilia]